MQAVKSKGSKAEVMLAKALWRKGFRYRKNDKDVFGKPDLTFKGIKLAVFVDGEFWHGKNWKERKNDHKSNIQFWHKKIENNMKRDVVVNEKLREEGWIVMRFWAKDVLKNLVSCTDKISEKIEEIKNEI